MRIEGLINCNIEAGDPEGLPVVTSFYGSNEAF